MNFYKKNPVTKERCVSFFEKIRATLPGESPQKINSEIENKKPKYLKGKDSRLFDSTLQIYILEYKKVFDLKHLENDSNKF